MKIRDVIKKEISTHYYDLEMIKLREQVIISLIIEELQEVYDYDPTRDKVFMRDGYAEAHLHYVKNVDEVIDIFDRTGLEHYGSRRLPNTEKSQKIHGKSSPQIDYFRTEPIPMRGDLDILEIYHRDDKNEL